ncbi:hypothetical protein K8R43_00600 [archaeon]|nr:hypothetical protein [archaeon]
MTNGMEEISKKLDVISKLLAVNVANCETQEENILLLRRAGLKNQDIVEVLGTKITVVNATTEKTVKSRKNRRKKVKK